GHTAEWDRIIACCLQGDASSLDQPTVETLLDALGDRERFGDLLDRFEHASAASGASINGRAAALLRLLRSALEAATAGHEPESAERAIDVMAAATGRLTPEMMLALLARRQSQDPSDAALASGLVSHITDT